MVRGSSAQAGWLLTLLLLCNESSLHESSSSSWGSFLGRHLYITSSPHVEESLLVHLEGWITNSCGKVVLSSRCCPANCKAGEAFCSLPLIGEMAREVIHCQFSGQELKGGEREAFFGYIIARCSPHFCLGFIILPILGHSRGVG